MEFNHIISPCSWKVEMSEYLFGYHRYHLIVWAISMMIGNKILGNVALSSLTESYQ